MTINQTYNYMTRKLFISLLAFSIIPAFSINPVEKFINNPVLQHANVGLLVKNLNTGETLYELNPDNSRTTASTMKAITTATALEMFGPDYRIETKLSIDGELLSDSTLEGNLYIVGGGDPSLGSEKTGDKNFLDTWVKAVRKAGIKNINGRIIVDASVFDKQVINPKWSWEDMGNYYAPGIHGISYMDNTYKMFLKSGKPGTTTEILRTEPEIPELNIENLVKSAAIGSDNAYFYGAPFSDYRYVTGEIPANRAEFVVKGDIPNPGLLLAQHFHIKLAEAGSIIAAEPEVIYDNCCKKLVIYKHLSPPLSELITETNIKSNNHYAEYLFKLIGSKFSSPATNDAAKKNIELFWQKKGLPTDELFQYDGSGLSACNAVSPRFFVDMLTYMKRDSKYADTYFKSLPVAGVSGTLKEILGKTRLEGKVHAKSGTIQNVKCYVGYIEQSNKTLVFALMVNQPNGASKEVVKKMEEFFLDITK